MSNLSRFVTYALTATSAVVAAAAILIAEIPNADTDGAVLFLGMCSGAFIGLAIFNHEINESP